MHEHSFIEAILSNIKERENVTKLVIEVGELAGIEASHLASHIKEKTGWDVEANQKNALVKCDCSYQGIPKIRERLHDMVIFECPKCGQVPKITEGQEIKILKIIYK
ncbi:MAG: hydrogenase/urease maturation nickel metallochaperone HypA [archaeon]